MRRDEFQELVTTVGSKADRSDLAHYRQTDTDRKLNSLSEKVTSHNRSSQSKHNELSSRISDNHGDIQSLKGRIEGAEKDIKEMKSKKCFLWVCKG